MIRHLPILFTLSVLLSASPAQAQNAMNADKPPSLEVIGFYSLSADKAAYARFVREQIGFHDPANFTEDQKALFRRLGRGDDLRPFTDEDRQKREAHLRHHMDEVAVFEVMVTNPDASFDISKFVQPDQSQSENFWQWRGTKNFSRRTGRTLSSSTVRKNGLPPLNIASSL